MSRGLGIVATALTLLAAASPLDAKTLGGRVVDASGKAMEGVMISAFDRDRQQSTSVYSQADGSFVIEGLRDTKFDVRARLMGQVDEWRNDVAGDATAISFTMTPASGEDLEEQRPASSAFSMLKWDSMKDKENFKMMCMYCHQAGTIGFRTPEEPVDWETMIRRMDGFGGLYRHTQKTIVQRLVETYADDAVEKWPAFVPPPAPSGKATRAKITEWDMGEQDEVMVHDLELGPDGLVYSVDMVENAVLTLDPKTGERKTYRFPGRYRGPHSIELGNDGHMWMTLCISGEMAKFDLKTKEFTITSSAEAPARRGSYPHTLRIDPNDPEGLIWYTDAGRNSCFSLHPETLKVKEYKLLKANQARGAGRGESRGITPYGIDIAPDGKIWYSKLNGNRIGRIDPKVEDGDITEWNPPFRGPRRLHVAEDGIVWVPGFGSGVFGSFDPKTEEWKVYPLPDAENQIPYALNIDPKGYVWICGTGDDTLHRFDPKTEELVEFRMPSRVTYTREIEFDEEGNLWTCNSNAPARHIERGYGSVIKLEVVGDTTGAPRLSAAVSPPRTSDGADAAKDARSATESRAAKIARDPDASGGRVRGTVTFVGPKPKRQVIRLGGRGKDAAHCAKLHSAPLLSEDAIVGSGGELANVFVYIKKSFGKKYSAPKRSAVIDQEGCMFRPHVLGVQVGQTLEIKNSDALLHNVRSHARRNRAFNIGQPAGSDARKKIFRRPEMAIKIQCDVHKWMSAYIHVVDHPFFAVTGEDGTFDITGLPAGEYVLAARHELFGEQEQAVNVSASGASDVRFGFKPRPKPGS